MSGGGILGAVSFVAPSMERMSQQLSYASVVVLTDAITS
jgi:hypothetical protein